MTTTVTWNIQWATLGTERGDMLAERLSSANPDIACLTETTLSMVPRGGHAIESAADYGYRQKGNRRKVVLWGREPWSGVDDGASSGLPPGRFIAGVSAGVRYVGVCVPWQDAHVRTGRRDAAPWSEHLRFLEVLGDLLRGYRSSGVPLCVLGDFNQSIPRVRQPIRSAEALERVTDAGLRAVTRGMTDETGRPVIDHVMVCPRLAAMECTVIPRVREGGKPLSDHSGIRVVLGAPEPVATRANPV